MVQGSFRKGYTDFDFNHVLGTAIKGTAEEQTGGEALGVVGDTAGPDGALRDLIAAVVLARLLRPRRSRARPPPLAGAGARARRSSPSSSSASSTCPIADARHDTPMGLWGWTGRPDAGGARALRAGLGLVAARCYDLRRDRAGGRARRITLDESSSRSPASTPPHSNSPKGVRTGRRCAPELRPSRSGRRRPQQLVVAGERGRDRAPPPAAPPGRRGRRRSAPWSPPRRDR